MMPTIDQKRLKELLHYDPITGLFTWLVASGWKRIGGLAGSLNEKGYVVIGIDGKVYKGHRLAWLYMTGTWPLHLLDHEDRNKENNSWGNLRPADNSQNKANNGGYRRSQKLPKGVYRSRKKFTAQIRVRGICHYLGIFSDADAASSAYQQAAVVHFGEFANAAH